MITIGLTTWSEHQSLMPEKKQLTLNDYAQFLPIVEVDSFYYALQAPTVSAKWLQQVPHQFQFIVKAHKAMTKQEDYTDFTSTEKELFVRYKQSIQPLLDAGQLTAVLFQFPPFFQLNQENVQYLRRIRTWLPDVPIAVEFRNGTWYDEAYKKNMFAFLKQLKMTHVIVDEAQTPTNSVPFEPVVTNPDFAMLRLHGRNMAGWQNPGAMWRKQRTLYRYNADELQQFAATVQRLTKQAKEFAIIFNNNSGGDAADNALALQQILGITFENLAPKGPEQTSLF
ncbi:DUF72 domain-containing protein [Latilactobacillus sakei]|uniref:DUF72 domain-containing protein n=1 Tax=Latilactobacillus sakei TaxID=1599 RepID=UPI000DC6438B|nr:DUF72 domain-containing protein [Latilactobacillus sakei]SPS07436.1 hypothetical protein LAS9624_01689 [Latilactobacillus sakei]